MTDMHICEAQLPHFLFSLSSNFPDLKSYFPCNQSLSSATQVCKAFQSGNQATAQYSLGVQSQQKDEPALLNGLN